VNSQKIVKSKDSHSSKICFRVVALETDVLPLTGHPAEERYPRLQETPKLEQTCFVTQVVGVVGCGAHTLNLVDQSTIAPNLTQAISHGVDKPEMKKRTLTKSQSKGDIL